MNKFFIVGCPRSGTTMLQQALNRHSRVLIPPETKFFFSFFGLGYGQQSRHIERLEADLGIRLSRPAARICSLDEGRTFYEEIVTKYASRLGKQDAVYFGEKTPEHTGRLPRIRQMFPQAKILVLQRDGRDVALSLSRMPWTSPDLYVNFLVWLYYHRLVQPARLAQASCLQPPGRPMTEGGPTFYFARYEDIVADPEKELGGILQFLGLPYEPAVARGWGNREGVPQREYAWKGRALQKISTDRAGVFRRELAPEQVAILERLGGHALTDLGYPLTTDGRARLSPAFLLRLGYRFSRFVCQLPRHAILDEMLARLSSGQPGALASDQGRPGGCRQLAQAGQGRPGELPAAAQAGQGRPGGCSRPAAERCAQAGQGRPPGVLVCPRTPACAGLLPTSV
jgi:hypothetical protein